MMIVHQPIIRTLHIQQAGVPDKRNIVYPVETLKAIADSFAEMKATGTTVYGEHGMPAYYPLGGNLTEEEIYSINKRFYMVDMNNLALKVLDLYMAEDVLAARIELSDTNSPETLYWLETMIDRQQMHLGIRGYSTFSISRGASPTAEVTVMNFTLIAIDLIKFRK